MRHMSEAEVELHPLVLCRVFNKQNHLVKRWLRPSTPALIPCTKCGFMDTAFARDAATHVCLDCYTCEAESIEDRRERSELS
jgi:hypothetical protein